MGKEIDPATWIEDDLYGRYVVELRMDFVFLAQAGVAAQHLRALAKEQSTLGYELDIRQVIGGETVRNDGS